MQQCRCCERLPSLLAQKQHKPLQQHFSTMADLEASFTASAEKIKSAPHPCFPHPDS